MTPLAVALILASAAEAAPALPYVAVPAENHFSIGASLAWTQLKDSNLLPLVHSGLGLNVPLRYERARPYEEHQASLEVQYLRPSASLEASTKTVWVDAALGYAYLRRVTALAGGTLLLGPAARAGELAAFYPNWDDSHPYWTTEYALDVRGKLRWGASPGERSWAVSAELPLVAFVSRPAGDHARSIKLDEPSAGHVLSLFNSDLRPAWWNRHFALRARAELRLPVTGAVGETLFYEFEWMRTAMPGARQYVHLSNVIGASVDL